MRSKEAFAYSRGTGYFCSVAASIVRVKGIIQAPRPDSDCALGQLDLVPIISANFDEFSACSDFDEFSACPDAEAVIGGVIGVAVIVAPRDILLMIHMANDRPPDQNDSCANYESPRYQLRHFYHSPTIPTTCSTTDNLGSRA
jgi:hypothetical protein